MRTHTACTKPTLDLDKMLGKKKVMLDEKKWDLALCEPALTEELVELVELQRHLKEIEVAHIMGAEQLAVLVRDISKVLVDLGMPPIPRNP
jgi:hypothetical protein